MKNWIYSFDFSIFGAAFLLCIMGLWFTVVIPGIDRWSKRFFMGYFFVFMLCCLSCIAEVLLQYYTVPKAVFVFLLILESVLLSLPLLMQTTYMLHYCNENLRRNRLLCAILGLWAVYFVLLASVPFIDGFLYSRPPPPTGNHQTTTGNCRAATGNRSAGTGNCPTAAGNRPRANQCHSAADAAAFHL